ncbi:type I restriction endonuclease subunit R [Neobacillus vireti]|uniref:Restriction endonuclease, type I, EcoRI, R subunit/Type III n=1 Tax=Neobacillus vireti LMG 21834 TaxID=1131730 RepID=A0AB94ILC7_9BACI|nr:DEAD/DEAH box helicase family protein [Neobacillus vireti]ETI67876.1 Restriction endonuclease, type I, EcoRI, R subunit/Type III [Neobacillus vireti LMG 21834]KLT17303.1 restriction endonuclease subunit R [Neobacillus vireti]
MIFTPDILKERAFQTVVKEYLTTVNGFFEGTNQDYNRQYAFDEKQLFSFLEETQEKALAKLKDIYKAQYKQKILFRLDTELKRRGMVDVLRKGIKDYGVQLKLAYFKPPTTLNKELIVLYDKNRLSVTEELVHKEDERIDLVIFLNGLPVLAFELKNEFTGQDVVDAKQQWMHDRSGKDLLFRFKQRVIACFAMDTNEVFMTTKLNGTKTFFLPFNKGYNGGKGNPPVDGKLKTHYVWEDVLTRENLVEILDKFVYLKVDEDEDDEGNIITKETLIFPRYHQRDAVKNVLNHAKAFGSGQSYLIQHSAGSGKTNTISWLSHRLATLHNDENQPVFEGVIVVTDRKVLDKQLQKAVYQLEHKAGMVAKIEEDSSQLAESLNKGTKIIITTIQKFPYILDKLGTLKDKNYAIIIDEAHSSTSGKNMAALTTSLTLEEAQKLDEEAEAIETDAEEKILNEINRIGKQANISFFAFTATPKGSTLKMFGTEDAEGKPRPFHLYSMKQAIQERFILDVLQNYVSYKTYYRVAKKIEDNPEFESAKATKAISRFVSLHPHNIEQKTEIIIEHFRKVTSKKLNGQAKAMVVTASRLHAVRYKLAFDAYIKKKGYKAMKALVAFSGTVKDDGDEYTEPGMNRFSEKQLTKKFDSDEYQVLLVAEKYQTGFDQPKLHTMFVDKKLSGLKAVQTLSRLNRTYPGKEDTFILDFVNDPEDIRKSFEPYYEDTVLKGDVEPNELYSIQQEIDNYMILHEEEVNKFVEIIYKDKKAKKDTELSNNYIDVAADRYKRMSEEEQREFISLARKFNSLYMFILQITPFKDVDLHKLFVYLRYLLKKISIKGNPPISLEDKVVLEYYSIKDKGKADISLGEDTEKYVTINVNGSGAKEDPPIDPLTVILERLNSKNGTEFGEHEKLNIQQIVEIAASDETLRTQAQNNTYDDFILGFRKKFLDYVVAGFDKNQGFFGKVLDDDLFRSQLEEHMGEHVYKLLNASGFDSIN